MTMRETWGVSRRSAEGIGNRIKETRHQRKLHDLYFSTSDNLINVSTDSVCSGQITQVEDYFQY